MTPNEIRIAIAEKLGWTRVSFKAVVKGRIMSEDVYGTSPHGETLTLAPNYPEDLNALHQAREQLGLHNPKNHEQRIKWIACLRKALEPLSPVNKVGSPLISDIDCASASAAVHAEALVCYLGVWKA